MADIRGALPSDAGDLALLFGTTPRQMALRLEALARHPCGTVLVATGWTGAVVGVIALHWAPGPRTDRPDAHIDALLVDDRERRQGIGRLLLKAGAQAARAAGCDTLALVAAEEAEQGFCHALGFVDRGPAMVRPLRRERAG